MRRKGFVAAASLRATIAKIALRDESLQCFGMPLDQRSPERRLVLLVEDNIDAQDIYSTSLTHAGFDVVKAPSVASALVSASARRPAVVVLDCRLPDGDGLELARSWRAQEEMRDVPIIVLTAFSARQDVEAALLAGADAFLVKPISGAVLAQQIERVLLGTRPSQKCIALLLRRGLRLTHAFAFGPLLVQDRLLALPRVAWTLLRDLRGKRGAFLTAGLLRRLLFCSLRFHANEKCKRGASGNEGCELVAIGKP
jgi:DNA-binding response OmpR family regulator